MRNGPVTPHPESIAGRALASGVDITSYANRQTYMTPEAWAIPETSQTETKDEA